MLEESVFSNDEIINQIKQNYNIIITKIEIELRGSANIFYVYDKNNIKYVLKEFESACNEKNVIKEIDIINHLKQDGIKVAEYIKTINGDYYFKYKNRTVVLMKYIYGYVKESNTGNFKQVIESAELLGKIVKSLENYNKMEEDNIEKWCNGEKLFNCKQKFNNILEIINKTENSNDSSVTKKIKKDIIDRLKIVSELEKINFSEMKNLTMKNCHGDFSIMQFIYEDEKVVAVLDFAKARKMPVAWEIIRSYTYIDEKCKDGEIDIENLVEYVKEVMKYIKLGKIDLKWMAYFYLVQLVSSPFGYNEYLRNNELTNLLEFAFWRCKMSRNLYARVEEVSGRLMELID